MTASETSITQSYLRSAFICDEVTGKVYRRNKYGVFGLALGRVNVNGYVMIRVNKRTMPAHRLIWIYHFGPILPDYVIDHINGHRDDNRISNLRMVTKSVNARNTYKRRGEHNPRCPAFLYGRYLSSLPDSHIDTRVITQRDDAQLELPI